MRSGGNELLLFGPELIKTISFNEGEILNNINRLYCPNWFEVDPCYSVGRFYTAFGVPKPKYRFDIKPQAKGVVMANANNLPLDDLSVETIMFDPPFLAGQNSNGIDTGKIISRFSSFKSMEDLWAWYRECLIEFKRILKPDGVLVFKNQDTVSSSKQYFSHCHIMNIAVSLGLYPKDMFILLAKNRIIGGNHKTQYHARKFHCYYWVFVNSESKVDYGINRCGGALKKNMADELNK